MKGLIWSIGGFCAAAAGFLVWRSKRTPNVEDIAYSFEEPWADYPTPL